MSTFGNQAGPSGSAPGGEPSDQDTTTSQHVNTGSTTVSPLKRSFSSLSFDHNEEDDREDTPTEDGNDYGNGQGSPSVPVAGPSRVPGDRRTPQRTLSRGYTETELTQAYKNFKADKEEESVTEEEVKESEMSGKAIPATGVDNSSVSEKLETQVTCGEFRSWFDCPGKSYEGC
jgi:hypothetical protein